MAEGIMVLGVDSCRQGINGGGISRFERERVNTVAFCITVGCGFGSINHSPVFAVAFRSIHSQVRPLQQFLGIGGSMGIGAYADTGSQKPLCHISIFEKVTLDLKPDGFSQIISPF